ncbi:glycosyltransferase family 4 protein [Leuconostoc mesenteroides]|uniref:glycosyltransferase family 4 protein n=1 Tax=Leuconostoc mesenteroides TaxID=1245 RepID=UPI003D2E9E2C
MNISIIMRFHDDTPSGGRKIIYDYANYLISKGHNVEIVFLADVPYKLRKHNIIKKLAHYIDFFRRFKHQQTVSWFGLHRNAVLKAKYNFNKSSYQNSDIVIAFDYGIALHISESNYDLSKVVYMIQGDEKVYNVEKIVRVAWSLPVQKIVVASWLYNLVTEYDNNVSLVKNYVRTEDFYVSNPISNRKHVVSLINHPNKYKGTKTGLKALELVHNVFPDLQVLMFGNFQEPSNLPSYVKYILRANQDKLREKVYNQSSVFLFTSVLEGWGLVATEAMACGAALVSTRNGGVEDFGIDEKTALLNNVGDYQGLADSIISLFEDNDKRIQIANSGLALVNELTFISSATSFERILLKVARKKNNSNDLR